MSDDDFDCYLCGASNGPDADFCRSCSGQLLKLPPSEASPDESTLSEGALDSADTLRLGDSTEAELAFEDQFSDDASSPDQAPYGIDDPQDGISEEPKPGKKKRFSRSVTTSIDDMRLSDALGLEDDDSGLDRLDIEVTSIPTVRAAENIPMLGTNAAKSVTQTTETELGKGAYALVAILLAATLLFAYNTFFGESGRLNPDTLGFVDTTTTIPQSTTTTAAPEITLDANEIDFRYSSAIVRVIPYACEAGRGEAIGDPSIAVALDEQNVLLGPDIPAAANAVRIVSRTGASRNGLISRQGGVEIASSVNRTLRHLELVEISEEADFFVGYDFDSNTISTTEEPQNLDAEISASSLGHLHEVRILSLTIPADSLVDIDVTAEFPDDATVGRTVCGDANQIELVVANPVVENVDTNDDEDVDADPEEADANAE